MSERPDVIPKKDLLDIELAYAQLNAQKTVGSPDESEFRATSVGPLRLTMDLARIGSLHVVSKESAQRYRNTPKSLAEIAADLTKRHPDLYRLLRNGTGIAV